MPRLRLTAARALETFADPAAFGAFVVGLVNDRGDKPAWKVPASTVDDLAELLVHGDPLLRARSALLLHHLDAEEQAAFDQAWAVHAARYAAEIAALRGRAKASEAGAAPVRPGAAPRARLRGLRRARPRAGRARSAGARPPPTPRRSASGRPP